MTIFLDLEAPTVTESPTVARCRCCHRLLTEDVSLGYLLGPTCRKRLGVAPRKPVRITGVPHGWTVDGQGDLLQQGADSVGSEDPLG